MRYVVVIDLYVHADSDDEAIAKAQEMAGELRYCHDNQAEVTEVLKKPFGSIKPAVQVYPARTKPKNS